MTLSKATFTSSSLKRTDFTETQWTALGDVYATFQSVQTSATAAAVAVYNLKVELDGEDPRNDGGNQRTKSRFWILFEAGELPYSPESKTTLFTYLQAAKYIKGAEPTFQDQLKELSPSTITEIQKLSESDNPAGFQLVRECLNEGDFIGTSAVRQIVSHNQDTSIIQALSAHVSQSQGAVLKPKDINKVVNDVKVHKKTTKAKTQTAKSDKKAVRDSKKATASVGGKSKEQIAAETQAAATQAIIDAPANAEYEMNLKRWNEYAECLNNLGEATTKLKSCLVHISNSFGTEYLDVLRDFVPPAGHNFIADNGDIQRLRGIHDDLLQITQLATSKDKARVVDPETVDVEIKQAMQS